MTGTATDVRRALYGTMAGDGPLTALLAPAPSSYGQSIYYQQAPSAAGFPYVIFNKQAGTPAYAMGPMPGGAAARQRHLAGQGHRPLRHRRPGGRHRLAPRRAVTDGVLSISGRTQLYLRRESDIVYAEVAEGVVYRHSGSLFRLMYQ